MRQMKILIRNQYKNMQECKININDLIYLRIILMTFIGWKYVKYVHRYLI